MRGRGGGSCSAQSRSPEPQRKALRMLDPEGPPSSDSNLSGLYCREIMNYLRVVSTLSLALEVVGFTQQ